MGGKERMKTTDDVMAKSGKDFFTFACSAAGYHCLNNLTSYWLFAYRPQRQMLRSAGLLLLNESEFLISAAVEAEVVAVDRAKYLFSVSTPLFSLTDTPYPSR